MLKEEPLAIRHQATDSFGVLGLGAGEHTLSDIIELKKSGDYRLGQLGRAFGDYTGQWVVKDPGAWADFSNDWLALQGRWAAAKAAASSPSAALPFADTTTLYTGLLKALKAAPEGTVHKGDFDDLVDRLQKAGEKVDLSQMPQPSRSLADLVLKVPDPISHIPSVGGAAPYSMPNVSGWEDKAQAWLKANLPSLPTLPDPTGDFIRWWRANQHVIVLGMLVASGIAVLGVTAMFVKAVKGATPIVIKSLPAAL